MSEYDSPWKEALDVYFQAFMAFFFPYIHADIDWQRGYEFLDKELQKIVPAAETGARYVDKLVKVWRNNGDESWVLIHIEVQSQPDREFPQRMYVYNYRIEDRYTRPVASLAILGDDDPEWLPTSYHKELWGCTLDFRFEPVKLLDYADSVVELENDDNPFAVVVLAHLKSMETRNDMGERQAWKFRLVRGLYERGMSTENVRQLFRFIDWMMDLPRGLETQFQQDLNDYQEELHMPYITSIERFALEKGLLKGIESSLDIRFGQDGLDLLPEITEIHDHEKLEGILDAIKRVKSLEELRTYWVNDSGQSKISSSNANDED